MKSFILVVRITISDVKKYTTYLVISYRGVVAHWLILRLSPEGPWVRIPLCRHVGTVRKSFTRSGASACCVGCRLMSSSGLEGAIERA